MQTGAVGARPRAGAPRFRPGGNAYSQVARGSASLRLVAALAPEGGRCFAGVHHHRAEPAATPPAQSDELGGQLPDRHGAGRDGAVGLGAKLGLGQRWSPTPLFHRRPLFQDVRGRISPRVLWRRPRRQPQRREDGEGQGNCGKRDDGSPVHGASPADSPLEPFGPFRLAVVREVYISRNSPGLRSRGMGRIHFARRFLRRSVPASSVAPPMGLASRILR